jgi:hypothetical protein
MGERRSTRSPMGRSSREVLPSVRTIRLAVATTAKIDTTTIGRHYGVFVGHFYGVCSMRFPSLLICLVVAILSAPVCLAQQLKLDSPCANGKCGIVLQSPIKFVPKQTISYPVQIPSQSPCPGGICPTPTSSRSYQPYQYQRFQSAPSRRYFYRR